jgi:hypothetical protein
MVILFFFAASEWQRASSCDALRLAGVSRVNYQGFGDAVYVDDLFLHTFPILLTGAALPNLSI